MHFDSQVVIPLAEVKLIKTSEPFIITGSDLTAPPKQATRGWKFKDVGYDNRDCGTIRFRKQCCTHVMHLLAWPSLDPIPPNPPVYVPLSIHSLATSPKAYHVAS